MSSPPSLALLVTCLVDQVLPEIGIATVKLLRRAGLDPDFPQEQTCCGQPFFNSGFQDEAVRLAKRTIEIFEPYDTVVLPSGSCTAMIRIEYPHLLSADPEWKVRAERLAAKTFELSEFLAQLPPAASFAALRTGSRTSHPSLHSGQAPARLPSPVTYHDSCHMCRMLGLKDEPRAALRQAGGEIVEMAEPDRCCGFGGLFSVKMPEVAEAITAAKLQEAMGTEAGLLVTADPGCLMQMRKLNADLPIEHLAVVLEEWTR